MNNKTIGDLDSAEKGSAARNCVGKTPWNYMPLSQVGMLMHALWNCGSNIKVNVPELTLSLATFQEQGDCSTAQNFLQMSVAYLMYKTDTNLNDALDEVIRVWELGEKKYARFNWMKGMPWSEVINSAQRHIMSLYNGVEIDDESGCHHGAHLICNAMMLVHYTQHYPDGNDLPCKWFS